MAYFVEIQISVPVMVQSLQLAIGAKIVAQSGLQITAGGKQYAVQDVQLPTPLTILPPVPGTATVFYQGSLPGSGIFADSIPSTAVMFSQAVRYHLMAGTSDAGSFDLVLTLVLRMDGGVASYGPPVVLATPQMILEASAVTGPNGADPAIAAALHDLLFSATAPALTPMGLANVGVVNTGAAVDATGSRIALRMQVDWATEDYTVAQWRQFYAGANIADHLNVEGQKGNISVFFPGDLVAGMVQQSVETGLTQNNGSFNLQGGVASTWTPTAAGVAQTTVTFNGDAILPDPLPNLHVDVVIGVDISVAGSPSDTLVLSGHVNWSANILAEIVLEIVAGLAAGFGGGFFGPVTAGIGSIAGTAFAILQFSSYTPTVSSPGCTQSGSDFSCSRPFNVPINPKTTQPVIQFNSLIGAPDGMVIFSQINVLGLKIESATVRTFLRSVHFNFANSLRSLGTQTISAQYIGSA